MSARRFLANFFRDLDQEIAQDQRELWELQKQRESRLPVHEQFALNLTRAVEIIGPKLAGKFRITGRATLIPFY